MAQATLITKSAPVTMTIGHLWPIRVPTVRPDRFRQCLAMGFCAAAIQMVILICAWGGYRWRSQLSIPCAIMP